MRSLPLIRFSRGWFVAAALLATTPSAVAQTQTLWSPGTGGVWFNPNNWTDGATGTTSFPPPNSAGAWATFGQQTGDPNRPITVDGTATVGRVSFTSIYGYSLSSGGIILNKSGTTNALIDRTNTGASDILTPLTLGGNGRVNLVNTANITNGGSLTIASLSGTGGQVIVNAYTNTGVAGTTAGGLVVIQSGTYGGTGSVTEINGGALRANEGVGLPSNTLLKINGTTASGAGWEVTQDTTLTRSLGSAAGNVQVLGTIAGFSAFSGTLTLRFNGGGQVQWGSTHFNPTTIQFGRNVTAVAGATDNYVFENGLDLNGVTRTIRTGGTRAVARLTGNVVNTAGTAAGLTVAGAGTIELSGTNTYNGTTTVNGLGVLRANEGAGLSPNTALVLNGGTLEGIGTSTFNRTLGSAAGQVRVIVTTSGFSAFGGTHTIQLNGGTGTVAWGSTDFNPPTLQFGSINSDARVDFQNGINLSVGAGSFRTISARNNPNSTTDVGRVSGVISSSAGAGGVIFGGNGVLELTAANTYTGDTFVLDSVASPGNVLKLVGTGSFANSPVVTVATTRFLDVTGLTGGANYSASAGRFLVAGGQTLAGSGTVTGAVLVGPTAKIRGGSPATALNEPTGQLTVNGSLRLAGSGFAASAALVVDLNGASVSGATVSRVAVTGAGNTFDLAPVGAGPIQIQLLNTQGLTAGQNYSFVVASAEGGFTLNGTAVTSYAHGTDFTLTSADFNFSNVSLSSDGSNNLILAFAPVPVPEPACVLLAAGVVVVGRRFRPRASEQQPLC